MAASRSRGFEKRREPANEIAPWRTAVASARLSVGVAQSEFPACVPEAAVRLLIMVASPTFWHFYLFGLTVASHPSSISTINAATVFITFITHSAPVTVLCTIHSVTLIR